MHSYASDSKDRRVAPWIIAIVAVLVAYGLRVCDVAEDGSAVVV